MSTAKPRLEHIVVLMLENRSYDHIMGLLPMGEGVQHKTYRNLANPSAPPSPSNPAYATGPGATWTTAGKKGPSHSLPGTNVQLFGSKEVGSKSVPKNNGFVEDYISALRADHVQPTPEVVGTIMKSFEPGRLPALHTLAQEFALCDHWFSEVPGPTMPNRCYMHAATSAGFAHNVWSHDFDIPTIYNRLEDAGKTWGCYFSDQNDLSQYAQVNRKKENFKHIDGFAADARAGRLPNYAFLVPQFLSSHDGQPANSMHAPQDVRPGDALVADIYEALRANEDAWAKTLFIITFDEHGGFFDHVAPPKAPNPDGIDSPSPADDSTYAPPVFDFSRLGLRVPTVLVSPLIKKGTVVSQTLQHTSVHAAIRGLWGTKPLTKRDQSAASFLSVLSGPLRTDTPKKLPRPGATDGPLANAGLHDYDPSHPANQSIDAIQQDIVAGWRKRMKRDFPHLPQPAAIRTHGEAHEFVRTSAHTHADRSAHDVAAGSREASRRDESRPGGIRRKRNAKRPMG